MENPITSPARSPDAKQRRMSDKLKRAIVLHVREGRSIREACEKAGLSESGWHAAMARPHVRDHLRQVQQAYVAGVDQLRAQARVRALEVARHLLENAKSESVKVEMVKILLAETKAASPVQVNIDQRQVAATGGYTFIKPAHLCAKPATEDSD